MGKSISPNAFAMLLSRYRQPQTVFDAFAVVGVLRIDLYTAASVNVYVFSLLAKVVYTFVLRQTSVHLNVANINEFIFIYGCTHENPPRYLLRNAAIIL
jgi:hypothetical protein